MVRRPWLTEEALTWSVVRRLSPQPAAIQAGAVKPPRPRVSLPRCLGPRRSNRAHDRPLPSPGLALGGDSKSWCLGVFQMPFTEPHQRPDSFPPPVICLCHRKMPTESYFAFPPSIFCFLKKEKKSWLRNSGTWVRASKKQICSKLFCPQVP